MSASPPKDDVEQAAQSPDDPDAQMNQDPHNSGLAYEFEVKGMYLPFNYTNSLLCTFSCATLT